MGTSDSLGIARCAVAAAGTLALLFLACWAGIYLDVVPASHLFVTLFTVADPATLRALITGLCSALIFGALAGAIYSIFYNGMGRWFQR